MDHLVLPLNPFKPIQVPYYGGPLYDFDDWYGFPRRIYSRDWILPKDDFSEKSLAQAAGSLQQWLFFGVLAEVFGSCGMPVRDLFRDYVCRENRDGAAVSDLISEGESGISSVTRILLM